MNKPDDWWATNFPPSGQSTSFDAGPDGFGDAGHLQSVFGLPALRNVDLTCQPGTIHAFGRRERDGKSTLMGILAGVVSADAGEVRLHGRTVVMGDFEGARRDGISVVFQEFNLIPQLTVTANVWLHREKTSWGFLSSREMRRDTLALLEEVGADVDRRRPWAA